MKKLLLLTICLLPLLTSAKIWRVNNTGVDADFSSIQDAIDAASLNDTIHVEGSSIAYGNLIIEKTLVLIGPGYFLSGNPMTQANTGSAIFGQVTVRGIGGDPTTGGSGSVLMGFSIQELNVNIDPDIRIEAHNVRIQRCFVEGSIIANVLNKSINSIQIIQCNINGSISAPFQYKAQNAIISNSYIYGGVSNFSSSSVTNCIFESNSANFFASTVKNCLFTSFGTNSSLWVLFEQGVPNTVSNCLSNLTQTEIIDKATLTSPTSILNFGESNQFGVDFSNAFLGPQNSSPDGQWQLTELSPAKGAGEDGTDAGIFGGDDPYVLSGIPAIPHIYEIVTATDGSGEITIRAKAGN